MPALAAVLSLPGTPLRRREMLPVTFILFIASLAIPAGLFGFMAWESREETVTAAFRRVEQTTGILHENAEKVLEINAAALERAAQFMAAPEGRGELHAFLARVERSSPSIQSLWVFAPDGRALGTSMPAPPPRGLDVSDREYFLHHRAHPGSTFFVSAPLIGRADGRQQFALTRRLEDGRGRFAGVALSGIASDYFERQWQGLAPELQPTAALVRDDGVVLVRHPALHVTAPPLPPDSEYMQAVQREPQGVREMASTIDGRDRIVGFRRLSGYPVSIAYAVSLDAVLAGWHRLLVLYGFVCGSVALALLAMTALVHRRSRLREITARLRERQAMVEAHEEVQRVTQGFQRELIAAVEARQACIARDLHDSVGASLAGVSLLVGSARALAGDASAAAALDKAQEQVAATAEAVRGISRGLMPAGTDSGGLLHALEQFAADLNDTRGVLCMLRARGAFATLGPEEATHVFRVVQEAVANALRHGRATELRIVLCEWHGRWRISVADNGRGCDFDRLPGTHPGLGLRSMQARARALGGELELGPDAWGGCRVRVTWAASPARRSGLVLHQDREAFAH